MPRFERLNHGQNHSYRLDGAKIPGVTTVIGILDKPALVTWAARESAGYAVEHWDELAGMPLMKRASAIERARYATNKRATTRGHRIHEFGERLAHGEAVNVPDEYRAPAESYAKFLDKWHVETIATEVPVCHTGYRYGGTFDAIGKSPKLGRFMLDIKSGKGVYAETALQLAAYRFADLMIDDAPMIDTDAAYVAHVTADGVDMVPVQQDQSITNAFLYCLELYETWITRNDRDHDRYDPVIGAPIYPDQRPADPNPTREHAVIPG